MTNSPVLMYMEPLQIEYVPVIVNNVVGSDEKKGIFSASVPVLREKNTRAQKPENDRP